MKRVFFAFLMLASAMGMTANDARYIFYFIGDGMGMGHVNATEIYNRDVLKSERPLLMLTFPVASQARTYSASSPITDSAAAGTALSTGHKTKNSMIGMNPDSVAVESIAVDFMKAGFPVGVGTTVQADDATPAAWYAHAANRSMKEDIAPQAAQSGLTFLAGGDFKLRGAGEEAFEDFVKVMQKGDYQICEGFEAFRQLRDKGKAPHKVLLYSDNPTWGQVGYTIDSIPGAMTCAQITEACLSTLRSADADKFLMMIEGGNIDWAAHANDGGAVIKEILNFQDAVNVAYQFYLRHPDETLIVITADHDTGGMAYGRNGMKGADIGYADFQRISKDVFGEWTRNWGSRTENPSWDEMEKTLREKLGFWNGVPVSDIETEELKALFTKTFINREAEDQKTLYHTFNAFTAKVFDVLNAHMGIGWTSTSHTGNFVPVYAVGANSHYFTGNLDNTEIPKLIKRAAGVK
ncbi:MAG: alkaline phosphatase [Muribaculaceae bacterium]|nr:alkaline phosphatase [Muribaculaceae bacterium]